MLRQVLFLAIKLTVAMQTLKSAAIKFSESPLAVLSMILITSSSTSL